MRLCTSYSLILVSSFHSASEQRDRQKLRENIWIFTVDTTLIKAVLFESENMSVSTRVIGLS